jgi:hypothetical protein
MIFEKRILRHIFGSKRMRMGSGEGFIICTAIVRAIKRRSLRRAGRIAGMEESRSSFRMLIG